jgi:hypothetical protein
VGFAPTEDQHLCTAHTSCVPVCGPTASYTGLVNGDTAASLVTRPALTTTASAGSPVWPGGYAIFVSGASDPDYIISYQPGTILVTPAPLTITANNATMVQGATVPPLSASYSGFVNGDSPARLAAQPTVSTPATQLSPAGAYPIVVGGANSPNYAISYGDGVLMVTPAPVVVPPAPVVVSSGGNVLVIPPAPVVVSGTTRVSGVSIQKMRLGRKPTRVVVLQFSGALNTGDAQYLGNYSLATAPTGKRQRSKPVALSQADYNPAGNTVTLVTRTPLVSRSPLNLTIVAAELLDSAGRPVDGDGDGQPGGNFVTTLRK